MGKQLKTVAELMQRDLKKIDIWCKTKGLSVNLDKTEVVGTLYKKEKNQRSCKN